MGMNAQPEPTGTLEQALAQGARLLGERPALAEAQAQAILDAMPREPNALLLLGVAQAAQGRWGIAVDTLRALTAQEPRWARAHQELGLILGRAGQGSAALASLRQAVALDPDLPQAWRSIGDHLSALGDDAGADAAYAQHLKRSVRDPVLLKAAAALAGQRLPEAEALLRRHLAQAPNDVVALRMLAELAARLGRHEDAEALLARCLELAPGFDAARQNYALVLYRANKPAEALAEVEALLAKDPRNPGWRNLKAVILGRTGDYAEASRLFAGLLEEYPDNSRIWLSQGHTLKTAGDREGSVAAYRRAIALEPSFGEAWWSLANLKTFRFDADDVAAMEAELARTDLADADRLHFEFALGKAREDQGSWAASFAHYQRGNELRRDAVPYNAVANSRRMRRYTEVYTREFFAARTGWGSPARDPIFVLGLPRSGSTLIEQILSSHPLVEGTMELPEVIAMTRGLRRQAGGGEAMYTDALAGLDRDAVRALGEGYLAGTRIQRKTDAPHFIDKMPNNFVHVGLIHLVLPNARIIDARRHPLACCFSNFKQHFARGQNFTYGLAEIGAYYRDYVALMAHFDVVLPGRVYRVHHEAMVEDTEGEVRRLLDYCGLPFDERCLRFYENDRPVRTASSEQVRRPINRDGIEQWKHYEPWLGPLKEVLGDVLDAYPAVPDAVWKDRCPEP
jgi:tetratricopeptide (TPR) repeat protein